MGCHATILLEIGRRSRMSAKKELFNAFAQAAQQPCSCEVPVALHRCSCLQTAEDPQLHDAGRTGIQIFKAVERLIDSEETFIMRSEIFTSSGNRDQYQ